MKKIQFGNRLAAVIDLIRKNHPLDKADDIISRSSFPSPETVSVESSLYAGLHYIETSLQKMVDLHSEETTKVQYKLEYFNFFDRAIVSLVPNDSHHSLAFNRHQWEIDHLLRKYMEVVSERYAPHDGWYSELIEDYEEYAIQAGYPLNYSVNIEGREYKVPGFFRDALLWTLRHRERESIVTINPASGVLVERRELTVEEGRLIYDQAFANARDNQIENQYRNLTQYGTDGYTTADEAAILCKVAEELANGAELPISIAVNNTTAIGRLPFAARRFGLDVKPTLGFTSVISKGGELTKFSMTHALTFTKAEDAPEYVRELPYFVRPEVNLDESKREFFKTQARVVGWVRAYLQAAYVSDPEAYATMLIERDGDRLLALWDAAKAEHDRHEAEWQKRQNGPSLR